MSWHFLERWVEKANQHSTLIGKFWITFLIVCRMVIVASVGDRVYNDEQSEFKCNTLQPGCTNVCFNSFSPISHLRFWSFQILFVATPSVMFVVYSAHKSKMKKAIKKNRPSNEEDEYASDKENSGGKRTRFYNGRLTSDHAKAKHSKGSRKRGYQERKLEERFHSRPSVKQFGPHKSSNGDEDDRGTSNLNNALPRSTIIKLPYVGRKNKSSINSNYKTNKYLDYKSHNERSSSFTSGVGTFEQQAANLVLNKHANNVNVNNNNNTENENVFVWREPKIATNNQGTILNENKGVQSSSGDRLPQKINEMAVWFPTGQEDEKIRNTQRSSLAEADMHVDVDNRYRYEQGIYFQESEKINETKSRSMPSAPPEYPGFDKDGHGSPSKISLGIDHSTRNDNTRLLGKIDPNMYDDQLKIMPKSSENKFKAQLPSFAQHFRWYVVSVFLRLCMECAFLVMQYYLFGLFVPELYKCNRWPCPNMVDCFISRPMEKTIFLWFMFIYSCICVVLNFAEFIYLIYASVTKYSTKRLISKMVSSSTDKKIKPTWHIDEKGQLVWKGAGSNHGLHPEEIDLENDKLLYHNGNSFPYRVVYDKFGNRIRQEKPYSRKKLTESSGTDGMHAFGHDMHNRDYMTFVLDSEEEREDLEIELDREEQADLDDFQDIGGNNQEMDQHDDGGGGGDGMI